MGKAEGGGSGWVILGYSPRDKRLVNSWAADHTTTLAGGRPVLVPDVPQERDGVVANVVFPTGIDRRDDLGQPDRFDVYYGMADDRIGVARMIVPEALPT